MTKTILIVEDEADIRLLYAEVLRETGYNVHEAPDGTVGLDKALHEPWDLLLLDIVLPGSDGINILKKIKEDPNLKKKPVLLLTNLGVEHVINDCFELGANGYLIKSEITPDKIVDEVGVFLNA
ncbi:MAG TPA: response regulator [Patescibacteria group bacterium]|nr:response regulator [Patescibacteria group bacterium]